MTHYAVQFNSAIPELATVGSLEQERFQETLGDWRGTHQLEFCLQPVPCSGWTATKNALAPNFRRVIHTAIVGILVLAVFNIIRAQLVYSEVGDFQHKSVVDHTVGALQPSVRLDARTVQIRHALRQQQRTCN